MGIPLARKIPRANKWLTDLTREPVRLPGWPGRLTDSGALAGSLSARVLFLVRNYTGVFRSLGKSLG